MDKIVFITIEKLRNSGRTTEMVVQEWHDPKSGSARVRAQQLREAEWLVSVYDMGALVMLRAWPSDCSHHSLRLPAPPVNGAPVKKD